MRNPYSKYYDEMDEICIVKDPLELQLVMNFLVTFDINCEAFHFYRGITDHRAIVVPKGNLNKVDLKEARDATSGILWTLRLPLTEEYKRALKKKSL